MGSQRVGLGLAPDKNKSYAQYHIRLTFTDIFFFLKIYLSMFTEHTFLKDVFCFVWLEDKG